MTANPDDANSLVCKIKSWLPLILILVSLSVGWAYNEARIAQLEHSQVVMEAKIAAQAEVLLRIQVDIAGIRKDIEYIRMNVAPSK